MVYIIGVDHLVQYNGPIPEDLRNEFKEYLVSVSRDIGIDLIAEEFSSEALHDVYGATIATAFEAAATLGVPHRYCDLEEKDMRTLGIPYFAEIMEAVKRDFGITEKFITDNDLRNRVRLETISRAKTYWHLRESFWYDRILPSIDSNILFICGHEHAARFQSLIREHGHECRILDTYWRENIFRDYKNIGID